MFSLHDKISRPDTLATVAKLQVVNPCLVQDPEPDALLSEYPLHLMIGMVLKA
jgi:hypothetical protein